MNVDNPTEAPMLLIERRGSLAIVTLTRPEAMNALSRDVTPQPVEQRRRQVMERGRGQ